MQKTDFSNFEVSEFFCSKRQGEAVCCCNWLKELSEDGSEDGAGRGLNRQRFLYFFRHCSSNNEWATVSQRSGKITFGGDRRINDVLGGSGSTGDLYVCKSLQILENLGLIELQYVIRPAEPYVHVCQLNF
jgi:hypothetical protein